MVNRARQIALLTRTEGEMTRDQLVWLTLWEAKWGRPVWVSWIADRRMRRRIRRRELELVEKYSAIIDQIGQLG